MGHRVSQARAVFMATVALAPLLGAAVTATAAGVDARDPAGAYLEATALRTVHIRLTRQAWDAMQPGRPNPLARIFGRPASQPADKKTSPFGLEYTYVHATVEEPGAGPAGAVVLKDVGLRFKGNSSYTLAERTLKRPLKADFNRYVEGQAFHGLTELNLHNNALDPSFVREAVSYQFFRDAGVPAPRTAFALVYLTVDGLHERQLLGLYTLVEEVDKDFLKSRFGTAKGLLLKPEGAFDLPAYGDDWKQYEKTYRPKTEPTDATRNRLVEFLKFVKQADDETFARDVERYLDVDGFLKFVAVNALLANMDSFLSTSHNFYVYIHPETLRAHFVPWDLNLSLAAFTWVGTGPQQLDLSIKQPYVKPNRLAERVLTVPRYAEQFRSEVSVLARALLSPRRMSGKLDQLYGVVDRANEAAFGKGAGPATTGPATRGTGPATTGPATRPARPVNLAAEAAGRWGLHPMEPREFFARRYECVMAQLADKSEGYVPSFQFGPFARRQPPASRPTTRGAAAAATTGPMGKGPVTLPTTRPVGGAGAR